MARAIGEERDAVKFAAEAAQTFAAFQAAFFDLSAGRYRDGEGTDHATVQGNAMALACGGETRKVDVSALRQRLRSSGACI